MDVSNIKPKVFIASTSERKDVAKAIEVNLDGYMESSLWIHSFAPGTQVFHELLEHSEKFDFAIIVISPDDKVISREVESLAPRDNVIFELGLFLGAIGRTRVFAVTEAGTTPKIMTDYSGVTYLHYDGHRSDGDLVKALSPVCTKILYEVNKVGKRNPDAEVKNYLFPGELIGLEQIYDSFEIARPFIFNDMLNSDSKIRIFINIASRDVGYSGSFFDVIESVVKKKTVDVRVLHASNKSPLFDRDRLISLGKNPSKVLSSVKYANESLQFLEDIEGSSLLRRTHGYPFIWRLYMVFDRVYLMPYFSNKDADKNSPVLVFSRRERSMYHVLKDWFDHAWETSSPNTATLGDIVSPAAPAGAALLLKWEGKHVFGIPKRDLNNQRFAMRFYGIGGKRLDGAEAFEDCARREGREELSGAKIDLVDAHLTSYVRNDGAIREVLISGEGIRPRLILEKGNHSGRGTMPVHADDYFLIGFEGILDRAPTPSRELAAVLLLPDDCLKEFHTKQTMTINEIKQFGGELWVQSGITIEEEALIAPHGTASFIVRSLVGS